MINLSSYKTIESVDLNKCRIMKYQYESAECITIWLEDGYTNSSGSFSTLGGKVGYLQPYTVTLNAEETNTILNQNSQSISISNLETYLTSFPSGSPYINGNVSG
tara:strand:+ start:1512 stop:1826 length:315 start_codon:yes stop_codon:yes gene_type:complete